MATLSSAIIKNHPLIECFETLRVNTIVIDKFGIISQITTDDILALQQMSGYRPMPVAAVKGVSFHSPLAQQAFRGLRAVPLFCHALQRLMQREITLKAVNFIAPDFRRRRSVPVRR